MDEDLQALALRIERLLGALRTLNEQNQALRAELAQANQARAEMADRLAAAGQRVQAALERLPAVDAPEPDDTQAEH
jgi:uncharacterized protein (TIGR02449 family)